VGAVDRWLLIHGSFEAPVRLALRRGAETLSVEVTQDKDGILHIEPLAPQPAAGRPMLPVTAGDPRFTRCAQEHPRDPLGPADVDCIRTYADACEMMLACTRGGTYALPDCEPGAVVSGPTRRCLPR
jgi:hypothetical protein